MKRIGLLIVYVLLGWGIVQAVDVLTGLPYDGTTITLPDQTSVTGELQPAGGIGNTKSLIILPFVCVDDSGKGGGATVEDANIADHPALVFNEESATQDSFEVIYAGVIPPHATAVTAVYLGFRAESTTAATCQVISSKSVSGSSVSVVYPVT